MSNNTPTPMSVKDVAYDVQRDFEAECLCELNCECEPPLTNLKLQVKVLLQSIITAAEGMKHQVPKSFSKAHDDILGYMTTHNAAIDQVIADIKSRLL